MAWIELHDTLRTHRKTWLLAEALRITNAHAVGLLACLWCWAAINAIDGNLSSLPSKAIAAAAGWERKADTFVKALVAAGFLDSDMRIHDWDEYTVLWQDSQDRKKIKTKERVQRFRDRQKALAVTPTCNADVTLDSVTRNAPCNAGVTPRNDLSSVTSVTCNASTVPNLTVYNNNAPAMTIEEEDAALGLGPDDPQDDDVRAEVACGRAGIVIRSPQQQADLSRLVHTHTLAWVTAAAERVGDMIEGRHNMGMLKTVLKSWADAGRILEPGEFGRDKRAARASPAPPPPPKPREYYTPPEYMTGGDAT